jgi:tetratricopeptide (TPR) repeat protein
MNGKPELVKVGGTMNPNIWNVFKRSQVTKSRADDVVVSPIAKIEESYQQLRDQGLELLQTGDAEGAVQQFRHAMLLRPKRPEAHFNLGCALLQAGKTEVARIALERAYEGDPTLDGLSLKLGSLPAKPPGRDDFKVGDKLRCGMTGSCWTIMQAPLKGTYGAVYIACNEDGKRYALKTLRGEFLWKDADQKRFEREAVTWIRLDPHPHIVTAEWLESIENLPFIVLEYVDGGSLEDAIIQSSFLRLEALSLGMQFCDGMDFASSSLGIVHRDIKPSNCLLTSNRLLKIADYGLARSFSESEDAALDLTGPDRLSANIYTQPGGTPYYMAPEQRHAETTLDVRTDVYAFGVMLFEMIHGRLLELPLDDDIPTHEIVRPHIHETMLHSDIPQQLSKLITRCLNPQPRIRPRNFTEIRLELESTYRDLTSRLPPRPAVALAVRIDQLQNKAVGFQSLEMHDEALAYYERALGMDPSDLDLILGKATCLQCLGRFKQALTACEEGLRKAPNDTDILNTKGLALRGLGDYENAQACFKRATEVTPADPVLWKNLSEILLQLKRPYDAWSCILAGLALDGRNCALLATKTETLLALNRVVEALNECEAAIAIGPRRRDLWRLRGMILQRLDRHEEAAEAYGRAIEVGPPDEELDRLKQDAQERPNTPSRSIGD